MKYLNSLFTVTLALFFCSTSWATKYTTSNVSLISIPLVCNAAPDIGCGSRSKPLLRDLENHSDIQEAWLNRSGTTIAIVWTEQTLKEKQKRKIAEPILSDYKLTYTPLGSQEFEAQFTGFKAKENWYRGDDVDKLSIEEAGVIADMIVNQLVEQDKITEEEAGLIRADFESYFKKELVKVRTAEELEVWDTRMEWADDIDAIVKKHIGAERAAELRIETRTEDGCKSNSSSSCKSKKKKSCCSSDPQ